MNKQANTSSTFRRIGIRSDYLAAEELLLVLYRAQTLAMAAKEIKENENA